MKKISMLFSILAFVLAVGGAFAFTQVPSVEDPAWIDTSDTPAACVRTDIEEPCGGGTIPCMRYVADAGATLQIYQFNTPLNCVELKEPAH